MINIRFKVLLYSVLFVFLASFFSACGSKNVAYNGAPNYGNANKSAATQKATMRSYQVNGKWYHPTQVALGSTENGNASWYGPKFHGKKTSNGEIYNQNAHTAAHKTLPMNTIVKVNSLDSGKSTIVRINDRGPFVSGRIIDLSNAAAREIDMIKTGTARVKIEVIGFDGAISNKVRLNAENLASSEYKIATTPQSVELSRFAVQIGAFRNRTGAERFAAQAQNDLVGKNAPYKAIIRAYELDGAPIYRVMLSGFGSEEEARDFIAARGIAGAFVINN